ncbi:MAG: hypothetical protein LBJ95_01645 [Oscillospiraceae bacterium]|jgi:hypothetical protein|nr:hypothetical protein [Oscillospiraceae bacterium]
MRKQDDPMPLRDHDREMNEIESRGERVPWQGSEAEYDRKYGARRRI